MIAWGVRKETTAYFHVLQAVLLADASQHVLLATLLKLTSYQELVEDEVGLLEIEDDVQLTNISVVLVHLLHVAVHNLEGNQFVIGGIASGDEEERGISAVNDLGV